jgi:hypothetical protein
MREIRASGLMSGEWKRRARQDTQAPATERAGLRYGLPKLHRVTPRGGLWALSGRPSSLCLPGFWGAFLQRRVQFAAALHLQSPRGGGDYRPRVAPLSGHDPAQPCGKGFAGNPGTPPPQEYPHHRALYPRRLRADPADGGSAQPSFGVKTAGVAVPVKLAGVSDTR